MRNLFNFSTSFRLRIRLEPFFFHLAQDIAHIIHFIPNILTHINGRLLLCGHRDAIARSPIKLDDLFLLQFVFDANDDSRVVGGIFQIIDDDSLDVCAQGRHQMPHQIVGERALLGNLAHEHRDRAAHRLIDINDEHFVVVAEKHRAPAARRQNCPHLHLDHRFVHRRTLSAGNEKQATCIAYVAFVSCDTWNILRRLRFLDCACMFGALNDYAFCGIPRCALWPNEKRMGR